jgi:hypothetical protein
MRHPNMLVLLAFVFGIGCSQPDDAPGNHSAETDTSVASGTDYRLDPVSERIFNEAMAHARARHLHERPIGEIMQEMGLFFRGKPYVAGILDEPGEESLICRLDGFDCVTFVETTLAMARGIATQDYSVQTFTTNVRDSRYRSGELDGYCSRVHYFTEWVVENESRGKVRDISEAIGGERLEKRFNFMTRNRSSYPRLVNNDELFACIAEMEADLARHSFHYIPQNRISRAYDSLRAGDIIALVTDIDGLDVTHTGLVYDDGNGGRGLLHASTSGGVLVSPDLQRYVTNNRRQIGILVARPAPARGGS